MKKIIMTCSPMSRADSQMAVMWLNQRLQDERPPRAFPESWVPDTGLAVVDAGGVLRLVCFVYLERSCPVAVAGWIAGNPFNSPEQSLYAVSALVEAMPDYCRSLGAEHLMTYFGSAGVNSIIGRTAGYVLADRHVQNYYHVIGRSS